MAENGARTILQLVFWVLVSKLSYCGIRLNPEYLYNITLDEEEKVTQIASYDKSYFGFMLTDHFEMYRLRSFSTIEKVSNIPYDIENAEDEFVLSFCTHSYLAYLTSNAFYIFQFDESLTSFVYREGYPSNYFDIDKFTEVYSANPWTNTAVVKIGAATVYKFNFSDLWRPVSTRINLRNTNEAQVVRIKTMNYGKSVVVTFDDNTIEMIDMEANRMFKRLQFSMTASRIVYTNYDQVTDSFVILFNNYSALIYKSSDGEYRGNLRLNSTNSRMKILRTGTKVMTLVDEENVFFYDMTALSFLGKVEVPSGWQFMTTLQLSNLVQITRLSNGTREYNFLALESTDKIFCHASCRGRCDKPFVPCRGVAWVALAMGLATVCVALFSSLCLISCTFYEERQGKKLRREETDKLHKMVRAMTMSIIEASSIEKSSEFSKKRKPSMNYDPLSPDMQLHPKRRKKSNQITDTPVSSAPRRRKESENRDSGSLNSQQPKKSLEEPLV